MSINLKILAHFVFSVAAILKFNLDYAKIWFIVYVMVPFYSSTIKMEGLFKKSSVYVNY